MTDKLKVLDLFSAAAGGWSLGMHRAGFETVAACEYVDWRRALYQQNNPGVRIYDDVRTLTADQLVRDLGGLPSIVVGSPPCQDISSANTKGKGVEGERSGLYFEAVRIIGEVRPRWFALENSANLRTRGADAVLAALEGLGYACWSYVVRAGDIGANHERPRCWIIGCDLDQVADAGSWEQWQQPRRRDGTDGADKAFDQDHDQAEHASDTDGFGRNEGWSRRRGGIDVPVSEGPCCLHEAAHTSQERQKDGAVVRCLRQAQVSEAGCIDGRSCEIRNASDADQAGQANGCVVAGLRQEEITHDGRGVGRSDDGSISGQVGVCAADRLDAQGWRSDWSLDDLAGHLRLDDGLSPWLAGTRIAVGGPRGTSAASLIVEAFGDAVVPQIPEAIGRAILRTEAALAAIYGRAAA